MEKTLDQADQIDHLLEAAHQWHVLLGDRDCSSEDREAFEEWIGADPRRAAIFEQAATMGAAFQMLTPADIDSDLLSSAREPRRARWAWINLQQRQQQLGLGFAAAACVALLFLGPVGSWLSGMSAGDIADPTVLTAEYATGTAEIREIVLSDGTIVTLDASTAIKSRFSDAQREVELLGGAAFFAVSRDPSRPFTVSAADLTARALGTEFDVRSNAGVYRVAVSEGRVAVGYPFYVGGEPTSLTNSSVLGAGEAVAATSSAGLARKTAIEVSDVASWRSGKLVYRGASVEEFVADLNRYSELPIELEARSAELGSLQVSGVFRGSDVDQHLVSLSEIHPIQVDRSNPEKIVLKSH